MRKILRNVLVFLSSAIAANNYHESSGVQDIPK